MIDVCLWLVLEAVAAVVAVMVVEALFGDDDDEETHGGGVHNDDGDSGVDVVGVGGEPDTRESGGWRF